MDVLLFWVGGALAVGTVLLACSLAVQWRTASRIRPYAELQTELRETQLQLADLADHIERKETRERVRRLRDAKTDKPNGELQLQVPSDPRELKRALRRKAGLLRE